MALHERVRLLTQRFAALTRREQLLLLATLAALLLAIFLLIHLQISRTAHATQERTADKLERLARIKKLTGGYHLGQERRQYFENKLTQPLPGLTTYVEQAAAKANIELNSITPMLHDAVVDENIFENSVAITLTNVNLERLVAFLKACEDGPGMVFIKQLTIEPRPQNTLSCRITVAAYSKKK